MMRLMSWLDRHWFAPARLRDLAIVRILLVIASWLLVISLTFPEQLRVAQFHDSLYRPLPALKALLLPLGFGWGERPEAGLFVAAYVIGIIATVTALVGFYTRISLFLVAYVGALFTAHRYSYNEFHHGEAILIIIIGALAFAPSGAALSVDALRARLRTARQRMAFTPVDASTHLSPFARWPLRLAQWLLALAYLSAAFSKLHSGGLEWMNGTTLAYYLAFDGIQFDRPLGVWLSQHHYVAQVLSIGTVLFELTFVLAIFLPRAAWLWLLAGVALHVGIYIAQRAPFFEFLLLYSAFVPSLRMTPWPRPRTARAPAQRQRYTVIYDGLCPLCIRTMTVLDVLDGGRHLEYLDLERDWTSAAQRVPGLTPEAAREEMYVVAPDGTAYRGFFAFRTLTRAVPLLWPLVPVTHAPLSGVIGPRVYAAVAARRSRRHVCRPDTCEI